MLDDAAARSAVARHLRRAALPAAGADDAERSLADLARRRGPLRWAIARLAAELVARSSGGSSASPRGWERLGYVRAGDYARERLGLSARSLHDLARVGGALPALPRLEAALLSGALPWSKVRLLARFATRDDEAPWIARARRRTVRVLEHEVRAVDRGALGAGGADADVDEDGHDAEAVETVQLRVDSALCFKWRHARTWAARVAGERISPGTALEMVTAEALSALPAIPEAPLAPEPDPVAPSTRTEAPPSRAEPPPASVEPSPEERLPASVEPRPEERPPTDGSEPPAPRAPAFLQPLVAGLGEADPFELDARLRRAIRLEQRLDAEIAPLLHRVTSPEYEWRARPRTLGSFARERLGMSPRKARALVRLERAGLVCPELRSAWRDGALSWVQAQILVPLLLGGDESEAAAGWRAAWIGFARRVTVRRLEETVDRALALREADPHLWRLCRADPERVDEAREARAEGAPEARAGEVPEGGGRADARVERQTCARPTAVIEGIRLRVTAPREVARLFRAVLCSLRRAAEAETGRLPSEAEAFEAMIDHALATWGVGQRRPGRVGRELAVFARDGWRCTIPGCSSRRNLHAHHIRFRSAGGSDEPANLATLCAAHHHRGIHAGRVRMGGCAPDGLWFELGVRPGRPPLARFRSGDRLS